MKRIPRRIFTGEFKREAITCYRRYEIDHFGRLCRSAIDHHRHSTKTGQCAIGTGGQYQVGENTAGPPLVAASRPLQFLDPDQE